MTSKDFTTVRHFSAGEFEHVGGYRLIDVDVVHLADRIRHAYGRPLIITSAYREPEKNTDTLGAAKSQHMFGMALDLKPVRLDRAYYGGLVMAAMRHWCAGFGVYDDGHIHIDVRPTIVGARWISIEGTQYAWSYHNLGQAIDHAIGSREPLGDGRMT